MLVLLALGALLQPTYPPAIYPPPSDWTRPTSEMPFEESADTLAYGYDTPFPEVARQVVRIEDFGAVADGVTDCTPAFYRALAAAVASGGPSALEFGHEGRYLLLPHPELGSSDLAVLVVQGVRDLEIRGQGNATVLVSGTPHLGAVLVEDSETVRLSRLAVDYAPLPFSQGVARELLPDAGSFVFEAETGYPDPVALRAGGAEGGGFYIMSEANGIRWPSIGTLPVSGFEALGERRWRVSSIGDSIRQLLREGTRVVYAARRIAQQAVAFRWTRGVHVRDLTVHASPSCALGLTNVECAEFVGYAVTPPAGSSRLLASNADGLYVLGLRGGITVRDCSFAGQGDDCINLHSPGWWSRWVTPEGDRAVVIEGDWDVRPGDAVEVMDPATSLLKGALRVEAVEGGSGAEVTRVTFRRPLAEVGYEPAADALYPVDLCAAGFKIVHNRFGQNRSRCMTIQSRRGLIEANTCENAEGYGVILSYGATAWPEGVVPREVTIRGNLFRNVTNVGLAATIEAGVGGAAREIRGLRIVGNRFVNARKMAMSLAGVEGLEIRGNAIEAEPGRRMTWNHPQWYPVDCSVRLANCGGVLLDDLSVRDPSVTEAVIAIDAACEPGDTGVHIGRIAAETPPGVPVVRDER